MVSGTGFYLARGGRVSLMTPPDNGRLSTAIRRLAGELGLRWTVRSHRSPTAAIQIGEPGPTGAASALPPAGRAEGYRLCVDRTGVRIEAPRPEGAFYALQTLAQLARRTSAGPTFPACRIEDWPSMSFRGAHWFPSASGLPFDRKLIRAVMARFKMNRAVIQCEAAKWRSHPEVAAPNSISVAGLRTLARDCRESFIEPIPLINGPGHAGWMFRSGRHLDLAEDRKAAYAYCVRHPAAQRLARDVFSEALQIFRPRWVHLGHDEVTLRGRFPNPDCRRCAGADPADLAFENAAGLERWLRARGVRSMVWGDMLFAPEEGASSGHAPSATEAARRRARLPHGLTVADWHYNARGAFPSLEILKRQHIPAIGCTWYEPGNIHAFAQEALRVHPNGDAGLLQTTWAGYFPDESILRGQERRQFTAFILAAEYAWSGRSDPPSGLGYDPNQVFTAAYVRP
jgi:hypothetical protein